MAPVTATELADSSALLGDPDALRAHIAEDGYLFFRGLLDAGFIREVGRAGLGALQRAGWTEPGEDPLVAAPRRPARAVRMRDAFGDPGYLRLVADPGFNCLPFGTPLSEVMGQLLGPLGVCYPLRVPRVVYPVSVAPRQPGNFCHKDYAVVQDLFTCWVPMGDVSQAMGGLALVPGSQHRARVVPRPIERLERGWVSADYEAGDVLVFHCLTTHAALPNRSGRLRFSGEYRWQLADQAAPRRLVIGPSGQEFGTRLFGRTRWWRPVATRLTLFEGGGLEARAVHPAPPSRFVRFDP